MGQSSEGHGTGRQSRTPLSGLGDGIAFAVVGLSGEKAFTVRVTPSEGAVVCQKTKQPAVRKAAPPRRAGAPLKSPSINRPRQMQPLAPPPQSHPGSRQIAPAGLAPISS
eukprot:481611-Prymnesium_polylepis.1